MKYKIWTFIVAAILALCGCGISNEDWASKDPSAIAASPNSFDIADGWKQLLMKGYSKTLFFTQTNSTCEGSFEIEQTPTQIYDALNPQYTYENYRDFTPWYDACTNQTPPESPRISQYNLYSNTFGNSYIAVNDLSADWNTPAVFPQAARVGDAGVIGEFNKTDSTGSPAGSEKWSYRIEIDTATTAKFRLVMTANNADGQWLDTEENLFRVAPNNTLKLISVIKKEPSGFYIEAK